MRRSQVGWMLAAFLLAASIPALAQQGTSAIGGKITDDSFRYARDQDSIAAEAKLDGIYVLRTSVDASGLDSGEVVSSYKALAQVERAFRPSTPTWAPSA